MIKLKHILFESVEKTKLLIPRRSKEERMKNYKIAIHKQILQYIKDGSIGDLDLRNTPITELPDNLTVGRYLDLSNTQITKLPDNLTVGGSLDLKNTQITKLPDNLTVGDSLDLENTPITELPDNLKVGRNIYIGGSKIDINKVPEYLKSKIKS
jgi:hypothetical protein